MIHNSFQITDMSLILLLFSMSSAETDLSEDASFLFLSLEDQLCETVPLLQGKLCEEEKLIEFLTYMQVINPDSVMTLVTKHKLKMTCRNIIKMIRKTDKYLKSCTLSPDQEDFQFLFKGVSTVHNKLCSNATYQKTFLQFQSCYTNIQSDFDSCSRPIDSYINSSPKAVCEAYKEITDCYYIKTSVLCGNKAADVLRELVFAVINRIVSSNCSVLKDDHTKKSKGVRNMQTHKLLSILIIGQILITIN